MRQGIPSAGNFLHQELAILTGAVEAMVVDVQCIMQALPNLAEQLPHQDHHHLAQGQDHRRAAHAVRRAPRDGCGQGHRAPGHRQLPQPRRDHDPRRQRRRGARLQPRVPELHAGRLVPRLLPAAERRHHVGPHPRRCRQSSAATTPAAPRTRSTSTSRPSCSRTTCWWCRLAAARLRPASTACCWARPP